MYSSWVLFALSHHTLVWWAADQVYPGRYFDRYAILGDDIVIADSKVASVYTSLLEKLQVKISWSKSVISDKGAAEFAKRFRVKGLSVDLSPVSVKALCNWFHPYGLMAAMNMYNLPFKVACRVGGAGYKALSKVQWSRAARYERLWVMYTKRILPFDLWVGRGLPLNPYLIGLLVYFLRKEMYPPELVPIPAEAFRFGEDEAWFCEYTQC